MTKEDALFFLGRFRTKGINENLYDALGVAIEVLNAQTDTPERKRGRWILQDTSYWRSTSAGDIQVNRVNLRCSCCGHRLVKAQKVKN